MLVFDKILLRNGLEKHNGYPLWKYGCTSEEYLELKNSVSESLRNSRIHTCCVDFSFYVSEWWKREYNGGSPSWDDVLKSISPDLLRYRNEFRFASVEGLEVLKIPCIRLTNNHYLRTLFVQGGLPLQRLSQGIGNYSDFLISLLKRVKTYGEKQVDTDWLKRSDLINRLSHAFRNDIIYDLSLQTVKAILSDNLDDLPFDASANDQIRSIIDTLQTSKRQMMISSAGMRFTWELLLKEPEGVFRYSLDFDDILSDEFCSRNDVTGSRVKMFVDEREVALYRESGSRQLKLYSSRTIPQQWNGSEPPSCCILSEDNTSREWYPPGCFGIDLTTPFLAVETEPDRFNLIVTNQTRFRDAWVVLPDGWSLEDSGFIGEAKSFIYNECTYIMKKCSGEIIAYFNDERIVFRTSAECDEAYVTFSGTTPTWIRKSSIPVFTDFPEIRWYDENGTSQSIPKNSISWRYNNNSAWTKNSERLPLPGTITYQVDTPGGQNFLKCCYIGQNTTVEVIPGGPLEGIVKIHGFDGLVSARSSCGNMDITPVRSTDNTVNLNVKRLNPSGTFGKLSLIFEFNGGRGRGTVEVIPPFDGVFIIDPQGELVKQNTTLCIDSLHGYRLNCIGDGYSVRVSYEGLINKSIPLLSPSYSLLHFKPELERLFNLQDPFKPTSFVVFEVIDSLGTSKHRLKLARYNCYITDPLEIPFNLLDNSCQSIKAGIELQGIPLEMSDNQIMETTLIATDAGYVFPEDAISGGWIVHSRISDGLRLRPSLKINKADQRTEQPDRLSLLSRIEEPIERWSALEKLLLDEPSESDTWKQVVSYYKLLEKHDLPAAVFDTCRVIARNPSLSVRFFFASLQRYPNEYMLTSELLQMEESLPFAWHLLPLEAWRKETADFLSHQSEPVFLQEYLKRLRYFFTALYDCVNKEPLGDFLLSLCNNPDYKCSDPGPVPKQWITDLRIAIGPKENWPIWTPTIEPQCRHLFPVDDIDRYQWGLILAPVKAALIVTKHSQGYIDDEDRKISRLKYYREMNPVWYDQVFQHMILKIISQGREN